MTSEAKIAANRRNAQRSTGPRSAAGKARTRFNAFQHGLAARKLEERVADEEIDSLQAALFGNSWEEDEYDLATIAAEAQGELLRVRSAKVDLVNVAAKRLRDEDVPLEEDRVILAFARKAKTLAAFDRYERRALSRRNRALRKLRQLQRERARPIEQVGPPRPKPPRPHPFDQRVARLRVNEVIRLMQGAASLAFSVSTEISPEPVIVFGGNILLDGDRGSLELTCEAGAQQFTLVRKPMCVGGGQWFVECPQTHKLVRDLYLAPGEWHLHSRHALGLTYRSRTLPAPEARWLRCEQLMERIGATDFDDPSPRPKFMRRLTYEIIKGGIFDAAMRAFKAVLGRDDFEAVCAAGLREWEAGHLLPAQPTEQTNRN
jgi:hypothetical protein